MNGERQEEQELRQEPAECVRWYPAVQTTPGSQPTTMVSPSRLAEPAIGLEGHSAARDELFDIAAPSLRAGRCRRWRARRSLPTAG